MGEQMTLRGTLQGHGGWVTQIATTPQYPDMILSASRGKFASFISIFIAEIISGSFQRPEGMQIQIHVAAKASRSIQCSLALQRNFLPIWKA